MRGSFWFLQSFWITIYTMTTIPIIYEHILNDFFHFLKDWLKRTEPNAYLGVIDSTVVFQMKLLCLLCLKAPWWRGKPLNFKLICPWQTQHFVTLQITSLMIISGMNTLSQSNAQHTSHIKGALNGTPRHTDGVDMRLMTQGEWDAVIGGFLCITNQFRAFSMPIPAWSIKSWNRIQAIETSYMLDYMAQNAEVDESHWFKIKCTLRSWTESCQVTTYCKSSKYFYINFTI